jgi:hypothetical protein
MGLGEKDVHNLGELTLDWGKLEQCPNKDVFRQICEAIVAEERARKEASFA